MRTHFANSITRYRCFVPADDNDVVREVLRELLEQAGYTVSVCGTGTAALELLSSGSVDLLIADLLMPEMDGIELIRRGASVINCW